MAKQPKFYVVWKGLKTGVFDTWDECQAQVAGYSGAKFKAFSTREAAQEAFEQDYEQFEGQNTKTFPLPPAELAKLGVILDSVCVDAACNGYPGDLEYRGVNTKDGAEFFHRGPFPEGAVNIGEFLAIVHALALLVQQGRDCPIYSDSRTALSWVRKKQANTKLPRTSANRGFSIFSTAPSSGWPTTRIRIHCSSGKPSNGARTLPISAANSEGPVLRWAYAPAVPIVTQRVSEASQQRAPSPFEGK